MAGYDTACSGFQNLVEDTETFQIGPDGFHDFPVAAGMGDENTVRYSIFQILFHVLGVGEDDGTEFPPIFFGGIHSAVYDNESGMEF